MSDEIPIKIKKKSKKKPFILDKIKSQRILSRIPPPSFFLKRKKAAFRRRDTMNH